MNLAYAFDIYVCAVLVPEIEALLAGDAFVGGFLSRFKRRASMSASELLATPRTLSSSVQAALTLKSLTSTRANSSITARGMPIVPTVSPQFYDTSSV